MSFTILCLGRLFRVCAVFKFGLILIDVVCFSIEINIHILDTSCYTLTSERKHAIKSRLGSDHLTFFAGGGGRGAWLEGVFGPKHFFFHPRRGSVFLIVYHTIRTIEFNMSEIFFSSSPPPPKKKVALLW